MPITLHSNKLVVGDEEGTLIVEANTARRFLRINPVGANVFIGGDELDVTPIPSGVGARITPDGFEIPHPACEAAVYAFGDDVEVEILEFIQE